MSEDWDESAQSGQKATAKPWRFRGPKGPCFLHPEARILAIMTDLIYDNIADPPKLLGQGSAISFEVPSMGGGESATDTIFVMESSDEVQDQILSRGGWR
jgi:hypothetical protein